MQNKHEIKYVDPKSLTPYARNAKLHPTEQIDKIAGQIAAMGFNVPIVVDKNMVIISGHGRLQAANRLNLSEVPIIIADHLDENQVMAARLADNKVAESGWDPAMLQFEFGTLERVEFNLELTGFDREEIDSFLDPSKSEDEFTDKSHQSVKERKAGYDESEFRQIVLIMAPEQFEMIMAKFTELQEHFNVEANLDVVEKLLAYYYERWKGEANVGTPNPEIQA